MRRADIARLSLLTVATSVALASPAHGYVRSRVDGGIPKYWQTSCVPLAIYLNTFSDMTRDEVAKSVAAAAHAWSPTEVTCADGVSHPFIEIVPSMMPDGAAPPTPAYDGRNTMLFYTPQRPYPPPEVSGISFSVVALTSTWARADGHIVDADVRVNAVDNVFTNIDPGYVSANDQSPKDLQNALTHELGHLIGLGHSCWSPFSDFDQPIDDQGVGVPYCDSAPEDVRQTVMFAMIDGNLETTKRHLSPDDIRAVCEIYPPEQDPHACALDMPNDGCGCSAADGAVPAGAAFALLALLGLVFTSRRARRAGRG
jgi:MYXO-CTERM domain-containing protein